MFISNYTDNLIIRCDIGDTSDSPDTGPNPRSNLDKKLQKKIAEVQKRHSKNKSKKTTS